MNLKTLNRSKALSLVPLTALWLASASAQTPTPSGTAPAASMPMGQMHTSAVGPHEMKMSMMKGMDDMQKVQSSGDVDMDFATLMKMHHQQALIMAEMDLAHGKSAEMKAIARKIIAAQKKEIAQFDQWMAKQK